MKTIAEYNTSIWEKVYSQVNRAVVFVDNISAELIHWQGGLLRLVGAGATNVKEFSSFESGSKDQKKGVFIISSLLEGVTRQILRDIIRASNFQYVVVITSMTPAMHNYNRSGTVEEDPHFYGQVEDRLLEWMGNMNYTAEVFHVPLFTVSLGNSAFITPGFAGLFPLLGSDLHQVELQYSSKHSKSETKDFESLKTVDFPSLPSNLQLQYKRLVSCLDCLLSELGVKEDIYSVGPHGALLATELEAYPPARTRRKNLTSRASIVLIDRTLDLATPTSHNTDTLLDKMMQVMPHLQGHVTDIRVNMAPLCQVHSDCGESMISPGCLASQTGKQSHLQSLITAKHKEALMDVNRQLVEAAAQSNLPLSLKGKPTRVTAEQLEATLNLFKGKYKEISTHLDPIQVAMATLQTLTHPSIRHCDELISVEKGLVQSLADPDAPTALSQILQMLLKKEADSEKWIYSLDDILSTLVYVFSLAGQDILENEDEESDIQNAMVDRIMKEKENLPPLIKSVVGEGISERSIVVDILEDMWEKLVAVATTRQDLQQFGSVLDPGSAVSPASQNSLCKQVVEAIFDPEKKDLVDVDFKSSGLKDMLKSGFGLFRTVAKPRPNDHPLMILFVVGGVTSTEVKQVRDAVNQYKPITQVIIGSTRLLSPSDVVKSVLCQNNVNPQDS